MPATIDPTDATTTPQQTAPSSFVRAALGVYAFLIVYASLYPFSDWQNLGLSPLAYLNTTLPQYWTLFDVATNIIGYIPLGILLVFALPTRVRGIAAIILASISGTLLSGMMEAIQTYLPSRVPSNIDFLTNAGGVFLGALIGALSTRPFLEQGRLYTLRQTWCLTDVNRGLIVLALWPLAQIYPQAYLFGHGQFMPVLSEWLSNLLSTPIDLAGWISQGIDLSVEQYWLSETIITACGLTGAILTLLCLLRSEAPKTLLCLFLIASAITVKSLATALLFSPEHAFEWITPGAKGGFVIGILMLSGLAFAPRLAQRRLAIASLLLSLVIINAIPANPYFVETLQSWLQGKFLNFNGAAQFLSVLWPFLAVIFLFSHQQEQYD